MKIGERIAAARRAKGWTQPELAAICGWGHNQGRISHYEKGRREPGPEDMVTLENALGLHRGALMGALAPNQADEEKLKAAIESGGLADLLTGRPSGELMALIRSIADTLPPVDRSRFLAEELQKALEGLESREP